MPTDATYVLGPPIKPKIVHDNGFLDAFAPREPTYAERAQYLKWRAILEAGETVQGVPFVPKNDLPNAMAAYRHFVEATGNDRKIEAEEYVLHDASGKILLNSAIIEAQNAAYDLYQIHFRNSDAAFQFTGSAINSSNYKSKYPYPATENWQKAIGGISFWISGDAEVDNDRGRLYFDLIFTLHIEDRYNFNPGQHDIATGVPDSANGIFEITGLAKQYNQYGTVSRKVIWEGKPIGQAEVRASNGLRIRSPRRQRVHRYSNSRRRGLRY